MLTLLIDADVLVYRFAYTNQHVMPLNPGPDGEPTKIASYGDLSKAKCDIAEFVEKLKKHLGADRAWFALSDTKRNFRIELAGPAGYKGNRATKWGGKIRPLLFHDLRRHFFMDYGACRLEGLEGDDVLGIWQTTPGMGDTIICTIDKDLLTVPGRVYRWPLRGEHMDTKEVELVTEAQAHYNHMFQTLVGDRSDGYPGCPTIGEVRAARLLDGNECGAYWCSVVDAYAKQKLTESTALLQARLARILQYGDYDFETREVKLWTP